MKIEYIKTEDLKPYANNVKIHTGEQVEQIKESIKEFGFNDPIAIWKNNEIIEGHGRLLAAIELELDVVPIIRLDSLTDDQRRAYALIHNKLTTDTGFDIDVLNEELEAINNIDVGKYGIESYSDFNFDSFFEDDRVEVICEHCGKTFYVNRKNEVIK